MTTKVDPEELRAAASQFAPVIGFGPVWPPPTTSAGLAVTSAAAGLDQLDTGTALAETKTSLMSALATLGGRRAAWESILNESADTYEGTDVTSAKRLAGLGDLNQPLPGQPG
ncbi:hypothetical protein GOALK_050_02990 [Gordonia alkanivorans NBRC 16433]|uniref:ESX-1 secretion-associated protein n=2 Tax=Gordonia alkanivorans TaxID=84096 RepID=F9VV05_9ACTN|nr:hypothetical protein GOALK_050_02990 [Gordonia alkanivorans NBRC 16433]